MLVGLIVRHHSSARMEYVYMGHYNGWVASYSSLQRTWVIMVGGSPRRLVPDSHNILNLALKGCKEQHFQSLSEIPDQGEGENEYQGGE